MSLTDWIELILIGALSAFVVSLVREIKDLQHGLQAAWDTIEKSLFESHSGAKEALASAEAVAEQVDLAIAQINAQTSLLRMLRPDLWESLERLLTSTDPTEEGRD